MANDKKFEVRGLGFWVKSSGRFCSHHGGLTKLDIEYLQSLKEGDRLSLYPSTSSNEKSPTLMLRRFWRDGEVKPDGTTHVEREWQGRDQAPVAQDDGI